MTDKRRCATGKLRYGTEQEARMALTDAKIRGALGQVRRRREERVYRCPTCSGFHLTSMTRQLPQENLPRSEDANLR